LLFDSRLCSMSVIPCRVFQYGSIFVPIEWPLPASYRDPCNHIPAKCVSLDLIAIDFESVF